MRTRFSHEPIDVLFSHTSPPYLYGHACHQLQNLHIGVGTAKPHESLLEQLLQWCPFGKRPKVDRSKNSGGFQLSGQDFGLPVGQPFGRG
jgi:hypothetical protein